MACDHMENVQCTADGGQYVTGGGVYTGVMGATNGAGALGNWNAKLCCDGDSVSWFRNDGFILQRGRGWKDRGGPGGNSSSNGGGAPRRQRCHTAMWSRIEKKRSSLSHERGSEGVSEVSGAEREQSK